MRKRLLICMVCVAVVFAAIGVRLYTLATGNLREASYQQSTRRDTIALSRGTIYDRYLQPLVNQKEEIVVSVAPLSDCVELVAKTATGSRGASVLETLQRGERATFSSESWLPPTIGVVQVSAPIRYARTQTACHVIGYVDDTAHGVTGAEKCFDECLGNYGGEASVSYAVDALGCVSGHVQDQLTNTLDRAVGGVALTLDRHIQELTEKAASAYMERGAVVVTDVKSGEVLASVSLPTYDPNAVEEVLEDTRSPLMDRTLIDYNLGSVFKILTAAAALENGFSADTMYTCEGSVLVGENRFHCHNPLGDGAQTMREAMANSCNCYFIQLALDVGASAIYDLAQLAGLSEELTLAKGWETAAGVLPSRQDLSADAALANLAIGQGDLLVTPYHAALLMQAVANKGIVCKPTLLYGTVDENGHLSRCSTLPDAVRLFSSDTAALLMDMLCYTVEAGTGVAAQPMEGTAAGKTGTAQTGWEIDGEEAVQSWFCGCYPAENPQYVIAVLSENGGVNGMPAAPLFATIADALFSAGLVEIPIDKPTDYRVY